MRNKGTFMRADKDLLELIKSKKRDKRESYANAVRRLIMKDRSIK